MTRPGTVDSGIFAEVVLCDSYGVGSVPPGSVGDAWIVDLGAHVGAFSRLACDTFPRARVLAVEMNAQNVEVLRKNVDEKRVRVVHAAVVGDREPRGVATLHGKSNTAGYHLVYDGAVAGVPATMGASDERVRIDDLLERFGVDRIALMKIDIEGAEFDVVTTMSDEALARVDRIVMEVHPWAMPRGAVEQISARLSASFDLSRGESGAGGQHVLTAIRRRDGASA